MQDSLGYEVIRDQTIAHSTGQRRVDKGPAACVQR
jgi:hypothetical protein